MTDQKYPTVDGIIGSWSDSSRNGFGFRVNVTDPDHEDFVKKHVGQGFHILFVPMQTGEEGDAQDQQAEKDEGQGEASEAKGKVKRKLKTSNEAAMVWATPRFVDYARSRSFWVLDENDADTWAKDVLGIDSKSQLDSDCEDLKRSYRELMNKYTAWCRNNPEEELL